MNLSKKIFLALMIVLTLSSGTITVITIFHFSNTTKQNHKNRLERKKKRIKKQLYEVLAKEKVTKENVDEIFAYKIFRIAEADNLELRLYDVNGNLLISSNPPLFHNSEDELKLKESLIDSVEIYNSVVQESLYNAEDNSFIHLKNYSFIFDSKQKPLALIELKYTEFRDFFRLEILNFVKTLGMILGFTLIIIAFLSYYISKSITKNIRNIAYFINKTNLNKNNKQIRYKGKDELKTIVMAYNKMVFDLDKSTKFLAQREREFAWKEMAKQVAHEIKNPLTPIKLRIQNFQRKYGAEGKQSPSAESIRKLCDSLVTQVDTISDIANAFSDLGKMPNRSIEKIEINEFIEKTCYMFNEKAIQFKPNLKKNYVLGDKSELNRVLMNLIKNGLQSIPKEKTPLILVKAYSKGKMNCIEIKDNGTGIPEDIQDKIFEPKFTTKNSGMGLGLAMVKKIVEDFDGTIHFTTIKNKGSSFIIELPKNNMSTFNFKKFTIKQDVTAMKVGTDGILLGGLGKS